MHVGALSSEWQQLTHHQEQALKKVSSMSKRIPKKRISAIPQLTRQEL